MSNAKECVNCPGATDHSTAECPMVRKLLERLEKYFEDAGVPRSAKLRNDFRALLTAQPQASAAQVPLSHQFVDAVKRLCKDFSDRQDRPYMGDVYAALDGLLEHEQIPVAAQSAPDVEADATQLAFELGGLEDGSYHLEADELEQVIKRAVEPYADTLRSLASYVGAGGYNAPTVDPAEFEAKVRWGIDNLIPAQSAPAGEREAFRAAHRELDLSEKPDAWGRTQFLHSHVEVTWRGFQTGASWQRTQSAGAPESSIYVEFLQCDKCQHGGINDAATGVAACHDCDWTGSEPVEDKCPGCHRENCMAAACPKCGARYVLLASEDIAAPAQPAAQDQGEVQRLREALEEIADPIKFMRAKLEDGEQLNGVYAIQMAESGNYLRGIAKQALAASTGQEVE